MNGEESNTKVEEKELAEKKRNETAGGKDSESNTKVEEIELAEINEAVGGKEEKEKESGYSPKRQGKRKKKKSHKKQNKRKGK